MTDSHPPPAPRTAAPAARTPGPQGAERKAQLLACAKARLLEQGWAGTSVASIVQAAGVAQGTFYLYFESKQALLGELRREVFRDSERALKAVAALPLPPDARLVRVVEEMAAAVARNVDLVRVFREAETAAATERLALEGRARLGRTAAAIVQEGIDQGCFRPGEPALAAAFVVAFFDDVLYESIAYGQPGPPEAVVPAGLRFTLQALGVAPDRVDALLRSPCP
jgi:AcrR family transcriptional regulator